MARSTSFTSERSQLAETGCELYTSAERYFDEQIIQHHRAIQALQMQKQRVLSKVRAINTDIDVPDDTGRCARIRVLA